MYFRFANGLWNVLALAICINRRKIYYYDANWTSATGAVAYCCYYCYYWYLPGIILLGIPQLCWTYSHHCQIGDKNPSKRWNGEFRGFRICVGWTSTTGFCVVGFMCPINFSRFSGYHAEGDHAPPLFRRLPRRGLPRPYRWIQYNRLPRLQGYHTRATTLQTNFWVQARYPTCG